MLTDSSHTQHNSIISSSLISFVQGYRRVDVPVLNHNRRGRRTCTNPPDVFYIQTDSQVPSSVAVVLSRSGISHASSGSWDQCNALHSRAPDTCTASVHTRTNENFQANTQINTSVVLRLTVSRCVRWCFALSLELLKALWQPRC